MKINTVVNWILIACVLALLTINIKVCFTAWTLTEVIMDAILRVVIVIFTGIKTAIWKNTPWEGSEK